MLGGRQRKIILSALAIASTLIYFYKTKRPWQYFYAVVLIALTLLIFNLLGGEI